MDLEGLILLESDFELLAVLAELVASGLCEEALADEVAKVLKVLVLGSPLLVHGELHDGV